MGRLWGDITQIRLNAEEQLKIARVGVFSQCLDAVQRAEGAFGQTLDLIVIQRQQSQVLQVTEQCHSDAVDLVGIQQPENISMMHF